MIDKNKYTIGSDYATLTVLSGKKFKIDIDDIEMLSKHTWCRNGKGYAHAKICGKNVTMHRLILNAKQGDVVDHINRDITDNRRCNLRIVTQKENARNRNTRKDSETKHRGVYLKRNKEKDRWYAKIGVDYEKIHLGTFDTLEEAIQARKQAELKYYK